jgi:hypothetical protein
VACNTTTIVRVVRSAAQEIHNQIRGQANDHIDYKDEISDPAPPEEQVPWWMWSTGMLVSIVMTCLVLGLQFGQK